MACVVVAFAEAEEDELASALTRLWEDPEVSAEDAAEVWALALPVVSMVTVAELLALAEAVTVPAS
jgi:tellurite resistance protein